MSFPLLERKYKMKIWTKPGRIFTDKEGAEVHCENGEVDIRIEITGELCTLSLTYKDIMILVELTQAVICEIKKKRYLRDRWTLRGFMFLCNEKVVYNVPIPIISLLIARDNCDILELSTKGICIHTEAECVCDHIRKYTRA